MLGEHKAIKIRAGTTILVVILIVISSLLYLKFYSPSTYRFHYSKGANYSLKGFQKGSGMTFNKPIQLEEIDKLQSTNDHQLFLHNRSTSGGHQITLSFESAAITYNFTGADYGQTVIDYTDKALTNPADKNHNAYTNTIKTFIQDSINKKYNVQTGAVTKLQTPNIKNNAWLVQYVATDPKPLLKETPNKMNGEVVMAIGKGGYYYLALGSLGNNWNSNKGTWQGVINSIKIDQ